MWLWLTLALATRIDYIVNCTGTTPPEEPEVGLYLAQTLQPGPGVLLRVLVATAETYDFTNDTATLQYYSDVDDAWTTLTGYWTINNTLIQYDTFLGDRNTADQVPDSTLNTFLLKTVINVPRSASFTTRVLPVVHTSQQKSVVELFVCARLQHHHGLYDGQLMSLYDASMPKNFFYSAPTFLFEFTVYDNYQWPAYQTMYRRYAASFARYDSTVNTTFWYKRLGEPAMYMMVQVREDGRVVHAAYENNANSTLYTYKYQPVMFDDDEPCVFLPSYTNLSVATHPVKTWYETNEVLFDTSLFRDSVQQNTHDNILEDASLTSLFRTPLLNTSDGCGAYTGMERIMCHVHHRHTNKISQYDWDQLRARLVRLGNTTSDTFFMLDNSPDMGYAWPSASNFTKPTTHHLPSLSNAVYPPCSYNMYSTSSFTLYRNNTPMSTTTSSHMAFIPLAMSLSPVTTVWPRQSLNGSGFYDYSTGEVLISTSVGTSTDTFRTISFTVASMNNVLNKTAPSVVAHAVSPVDGYDYFIGNIVLHHCFPGYGVYATTHFQSGDQVWSQSGSDTLVLDNSNVQCHLIKATNQVHTGLVTYMIRERRAQATTTFVNMFDTVCSSNLSSALEWEDMASVYSHTIVPIASPRASVMSRIAVIDPDNTVTTMLPNPVIPMVRSSNQWSAWTLFQNDTVRNTYTTPVDLLSVVVCDTDHTIWASVVNTNSSVVSPIYHGGPCLFIHDTSTTPLIVVQKDATQSHAFNMEHVMCAADYNLVEEPVVYGAARLDSDGNFSRVFVSVDTDGTYTVDNTSDPYPVQNTDLGYHGDVCFFQTGIRLFYEHGMVNGPIHSLRVAMNAQEILVRALHPTRTFDYRVYPDLVDDGAASKSVVPTWFQRYASTIPLLTSSGDYYNTKAATPCGPAILRPQSYTETIAVSPWSRMGLYNSTHGITACSSIYMEVTTNDTSSSDQVCTVLDARDFHPNTMAYWLPTRPIRVNDYEWYMYNTSATETTSVNNYTRFYTYASDPNQYYTVRSRSIKALGNYVVHQHHDVSYLEAPSLSDVISPLSTTEYRYTMLGLPGYASMPRAYTSASPRKQVYENGFLVSNQSYQAMFPMYERRYQYPLANTTIDAFRRNASVYLNSQLSHPDARLSIPLGIYGRTTILQSDVGYRPNPRRACPLNTHHFNQSTGVCTANRVCNYRFEYEVARPTPYSDRACKEQTDCGSLQYVSTKASATTDRVCTAHPVCGPSDYVARAPTVTSARVCRPKTTSCPHGYYFNPQTNVMDPGVVKLNSSGCVKCPPGTSSYLYVHGNETFGSTHTSKSCMDVSSMVFPTAPAGQYYFTALFLQTDGSQSPTKYTLPCRVCASTETQIRPCQQTQNSVCQVNTTGVTAPPTPPPTPCDRHEYFNRFNGIDRCIPCTRCLKDAYAQHCTPTEDAICSVISTWKFIHLFIMIIASIWYLFIFMITCKTALGRIRAMHNESTTPRQPGPISRAALSIAYGVKTCFSWPGETIQRWADKPIDKKAFLPTTTRMKETVIETVMWPIRKLRQHRYKRVPQDIYSPIRKS